MENKKKELTLEELKAQYNALGEKIAKQEKMEAEEREAKLKAEKDARKKEIESTEKKLNELISAYIKDYGSYSTSRFYDTKTNEIPNIWRMFL